MEFVAAPRDGLLALLGRSPIAQAHTDPHRYGQGAITFTVTNPNSGFVNFGNGGIAPGNTTFFSLEGGNLTASLQVKIPDPVLVFRKSGPATMALGQWGAFGLNVQNTGGSDAWNATIVDKLPTGATGGMCARQPQILSAQRVPGRWRDTGARQGTAHGRHGLHGQLCRGARPAR